MPTRRISWSGRSSVGTRSGQYLHRETSVASPTTTTPINTAAVRQIARCRLAMRNFSSGPARAVDGPTVDGWDSGASASAAAEAAAAALMSELSALGGTAGASIGTACHDEGADPSGAAGGASVVIGTSGAGVTAGSV